MEPNSFQTHLAARDALYAKIRGEVAALLHPVDDFPLPSSRPPMKHGGAHHGYVPVVHKPEHTCQPGEIPAGPWIKAEAARLGITGSNLWYRIRHGHYPHVTVRRITSWLTFLTIGQPSDVLPLPRLSGRPNLNSRMPRLSLKVLGRKEYIRQRRLLEKEAA